MTVEQCKPLTILNVDNLCISLWKASVIERVRFLFIGKLWLTVRSGNTQPPVKITIDKPFVEGEDNGDAEEENNRGGSCVFHGIHKR